MQPLLSAARLDVNLDGQPLVNRLAGPGGETCLHIRRHLLHLGKGRQRDRPETNQKFELPASLCVH